MNAEQHYNGGYDMMFHRPYLKKHTVASTAVALSFNLGFKPVYVKIVNVTKKRSLEWFGGEAPMANASGFLIKEGAADIFSPALVTTNAITPTDLGFNLGVETSINVANDVLYVLAL
jgi:hypothetical protein